MVHLLLYIVCTYGERRVLSLV